MADRSYCSPIPETGLARLDEAEAHHLSRVLRKTIGESVEIFDGKGRSALAEIVAISKKSVDLKLLKIWESPKPVGEVILATAVPKGDRFRWLIEKVVELGIDRVVPLITERSVVKPGEGKREKMEQAVIEASKQCGRNRLMTIDSPRSFSDFLAEALPLRENEIALIAHPGGMALREAFPSPFPEWVVFLVGPEGGFTEQEISEAQTAGAVPVSLGTNILRIETAGILLAGYAATIRNK